MAVIGAEPAMMAAAMRGRTTMRYDFFYWPGIQGRGEFVRLALEEAGADYVDVARGSEKDGQGVPALLALLNGKIATPPYAPPFLRAGKLLISQSANILFYLGSRHKLAPASEAGRLWVHQLQLSVIDFIKEIHDTHHPITSSLYYEEQKDVALRYTAKFRELRAPKYLGYFERVLEGNPAGDKFLAGRSLSYADLSMFQLVAGLRYAFPKAMRGWERKTPRLVALHDRVAARRNVAAYLASARRIPFNESGVFRRYPELDG
jgi:glutathione S-transferase